MSYTLTLTGRDNVLSATYYPPIELSLENKYSIGLVGFHSYHTIPNIENGANKFYYNNKVIVIPTGCYQITDIEKYLQAQLINNHSNITRANPTTEKSTRENFGDLLFSLKANNATLKCEIKSVYDINFKAEDSIGKLLGFSGVNVLKANTIHESDLSVNIIKVSTIRVECNIASGAYYNNQVSHTIYEFSPQVHPGYAINIEPRNIIYLPINSNYISDISLRLIDQNGEPVNFRQEKIIVRLELKQNGSNF